MGDTKMIIKWIKFEKPSSDRQRVAALLNKDLFGGGPPSRARELTAEGRSG
jgi:hypothetical protein